LGARVPGGELGPPDRPIHQIVRAQRNVLGPRRPLHDHVPRVRRSAETAMTGRLQPGVGFALEISVVQLLSRARGLGPSALDQADAAAGRSERPSEGESRGPGADDADVHRLTLRTLDHAEPSPPSWQSAAPERPRGGPSSTRCRTGPPLCRLAMIELISWA